MLASCLLVVHDTSRGCENDVSELTRRQKLDNPLLEIGEADIVSGGDNTSLVEAIIELAAGRQEGDLRLLPAVQLDDNLARSVIIDFLKFANIA